MTIDREKLLGDGLDLQNELAETQRAIREITLLIEQSQSEVAKLTQRNAAITAHLQQVQAKLQQTPPQEIRMAYDAALDAQQRLFVMHGQLDKLQASMTLQPMIVAPVAAGQEIGKVEVRLGGQVVHSAPLVALQAVEEGGLFRRVWDSIRLFFYGLFN